MGCLTPTFCHSAQHLLSLVLFQSGTGMRISRRRVPHNLECTSPLHLLSLSPLVPSALQDTQGLSLSLINSSYVDYANRSISTQHRSSSPKIQDAFIILIFKCSISRRSSSLVPGSRNNLLRCSETDAPEYQTQHNQTHLHL